MKSSIINKCRNVYVAFAEKCMEIFEHIRLMFIQEKELKLTNHIISEIFLKLKILNESLIFFFFEHRIKYFSKLFCVYSLKYQQQVSFVLILEFYSLTISLILYIPLSLPERKIAALTAP
jgi:hypothetical protein